MIDFGFLFLGALALGLSRFGYFPSESIVVWKTSILVTEFGQWLSLAAFCLALIPPLVGYRRVYRVLDTALLVIAGILFLQPTFQMRRALPDWSAQLRETFGPVDLEAPSWLSVWQGRAAPLKSSAIEFSQTPQGPLKMRAFLSQDPAHPAPFVVVVHGGGWDSGTADQLPELNSVLAQNGVAAFSIDYRLAPAATWPMPREDVFAAVAYIKAHHTELNIDPSRWVILGRSAGGQIALCAGYQSTDSSLKGVIAFYPPTDMIFAYKYGREDDILNSRQLVRDYLGGPPEKAEKNYLDASPMEFVRRDLPPTLMFHGPRDPLVWVRHSERLQDKLQEVGAKSLFIEIPWVTHGFDYNLNGPGGRVSTYAVLYFLKRVFA